MADDHSRDGFFGLMMKCCLRTSSKFSELLDQIVAVSAGGLTQHGHRHAGLGCQHGDAQHEGQ